MTSVALLTFAALMIAPLLQASPPQWQPRAPAMPPWLLDTLKGGGLSDDRGPPSGGGFSDGLPSGGGFSADWGPPSGGGFSDGPPAGGGFVDGPPSRNTAPDSRGNCHEYICR